MQIRLAAAADISAVQQVSHRAYEIYEVLLGYRPMALGEDYAARIARGDVWVGELERETIAALVLEILPAHLLIVSVVVDPDWQGEGHGRSLLLFAEQRARELGHSELRLTANSLMHRSISLYRHCGYRTVAERAHPTRPGHALTDMAKLLPVESR